MAIERERKFLVDHSKLPEAALKEYYDLVSGYFTDGPVAIRIASRLGGKQKICFKGPGTEEREEFEYVVPPDDAERLLALAPTQIKKRRYEYEGWEIDRIEVGPYRHLWLAEWEEGPNKGGVPTPLPAWITREVTEELGYSNMSLAWRYGRK